MSSFPKCRVSLRICDNDLDPLEITEMLRVEPDAFHKKGDPNMQISKKGKQMEFSPYNSGLWSINSKEMDSATIGVHIKALLLILEPLKNELSILHNRGYKMDLFCGLFAQGCSQPGLELDASLLRRVGELNLRVGMCFYS